FSVTPRRAPGRHYYDFDSKPNPARCTNPGLSYRLRNGKSSLPADVCDTDPSEPHVGPADFCTGGYLGSTPRLYTTTSPNTRAWHASRSRGSSIERGPRCRSRFARSHRPIALTRPSSDTISIAQFVHSPFRGHPCGQ